MADDLPPPATPAGSLLYKISSQVVSLRSKAASIAASANPAALGSFVTAQALRPLALAASLLEARGAYVSVSLSVQLGRRPDEEPKRDASTREAEVERIEDEIARLTDRLEELRRISVDG